LAPAAAAVPTNSSLLSKSSSYSSLDDHNIVVDESLCFSILKALSVAVNTGELEVRSRALRYLFQILNTYGEKMARVFWLRISNEVLFGIFAPVTQGLETNMSEDTSLWLSTTLTQAARQFVGIFAAYYPHLRELQPRILKLLRDCIFQGNEMLAQLGTSCLFQLVRETCAFMTGAEWQCLCDMIAELFESTRADKLFEIQTRAQEPGSKDVEFPELLRKCVLQLLLIQTVNEIITSDAAIQNMPLVHIVQISRSLETSYRFAVKFNQDMDLRTILFKSGFTRSLPNLLQQETTSAASLFAVLLRVLSDDERPDQGAVASDVRERLVQLAIMALEIYRDMRPDEHKRHISSWKPLLLNLLRGLHALDDAEFDQVLPRLYGSLVDVLAQPVPSDVRNALREVLRGCTIQGAENL
jgi:brefeldin A-inhibited guanine nucleotide-exchange protein